MTNWYGEANGVVGLTVWRLKNDGVQQTNTAVRARGARLDCARDDRQIAASVCSEDIPSPSASKYRPSRVDPNHPQFRGVRRAASASVDKASKAVSPQWHRSRRWLVWI